MERKDDHQKQSVRSVSEEAEYLLREHKLTKGRIQTLNIFGEGFDVIAEAVIQNIKFCCAEQAEEKAPSIESVPLYQNRKPVGIALSIPTEAIKIVKDVLTDTNTSKSPEQEAGFSKQFHKRSPKVIKRLAQPGDEQDTYSPHTRPRDRIERGF